MPSSFGSLKPVTTLGNHASGVASHLSNLPRHDVEYVPVLQRARRSRLIILDLIELLDHKVLEQSFHLRPRVMRPVRHHRPIVLLPKELARKSPAARQRMHHPRPHLVKPLWCTKRQRIRRIDQLRLRNLKLHVPRRRGRQPRPILLGHARPHQCKRPRRVILRHHRPPSPQQFQRVASRPAPQIHRPPPRRRRHAQPSHRQRSIRLALGIEERKCLEQCVPRWLPGNRLVVPSPVPLRGKLMGLPSRARDVRQLFRRRVGDVRFGFR
jgi:hypothetical protein